MPKKCKKMSSFAYLFVGFFTAKQQRRQKNTGMVIILGISMAIKENWRRSSEILLKHREQFGAVEIGLFSMGWIRHFHQ